MSLQIGQKNFKSAIQETFVKASREKDVNGDGKNDYIIKVQTSPHWDGCRHYTTYVDVDGDNKYDYIINETVPMMTDKNGNTAPAKTEVHKAQENDNRDMNNMLKDLMNPNPNGEKMRILDISF